MSAQPILPTDATLDAEGRIVVDAPCVNCGYNLRMLKADAVCPECSTPVGYSLRGYLLKYASPQWVQRVARGGWLLVVVIGLSWLVGLAVGAWGAYLGMSQVAAGRAVPAFDTRAVSLVSVIAFAPVAVLTLVALVFFTTPNPADTLPGTDSAARRWLRGSLWLYAASTLFAWFVGLMPESVLSVGTRAAFTALSMPAGLAISTLMGVLGLRYTGQLMLRIPRPGLVRFARVCFWGVLICGLLVATAYAFLSGTMAQNIAAASTPSTAPSSASMPFGAAGPPAPAAGLGMMLAACPGCVGIGFFVASFVLLIMASAALSGAARDARQNAASPTPGAPPVGSPS
jgi:hypothetical protein